MWQKKRNLEKIGFILPQPSALSLRGVTMQLECEISGVPDYDADAVTTTLTT